MNGDLMQMGHDDMGPRMYTPKANELAVNGMNEELRKVQ